MNAIHRSVAAALSAGGSRHDRALAFAGTALVLYAASLALPLATAGKFGEHHAGYLFSGIASLWQQGNGYLAVLVFGCGIAAPLLLTGSLALLLLAARRGHAHPGLRPCLHFAARLESWSMPEVQVLGVVVAFIKLSALVPSRPAAGLWCYGAAALCALVAWRQFDAARVAAVLFPHRPEDAR